MKKMITRLVFSLMILSTILAPVSAAAFSEPAPAATAQPATADQEAVDAALKEFKGLSRREKKARLKEAKKSVERISG